MLERPVATGARVRIPGRTALAVSRPLRPDGPCAGQLPACAAAGTPAIVRVAARVRRDGASGPDARAATRPRREAFPLLFKGRQSS